jgi:hypothetical protein
VAGPGHKAVDGSLTGADIGDRSLTGNDIAGGSVTGANIFGKSITAVNIADGTLTGSQIADNSLGGGQIDESSLGTVPSASNSAQLGGLPPGAFGTAVRSASQRSGSCATVDVTECAKVRVQVPSGRAYDAIVWSSISAYHTDAGNTGVVYCPALNAQCLTPSGSFEDGINIQPNYSESGAAIGTTTELGQGHPLSAGTWDFSTAVQINFGGGSLADSPLQRVHTTVLLFDSAVPELPGSGPRGGCATSSGGSSGTTSSGGSSGTSSGGSSGTSSSSGGSSGTSSGGSSGTSSGGSSGTTSGTSGC